MNRKGFDFIDKRCGVAAFLHFLEQRLGGDGNGYALIKGGECEEMHKGVNLSVNEIAKRARTSDFDWFIFHTRRASCGTVSDANCHPFKNPETGDVLVANGTEWDICEYNRDQGLKCTDTETLLLEFLDPDNYTASLKICSSALIGLHNGKVFAIRNRGSLYRLTAEPDTICIASEFLEHSPTFHLTGRPINAYFEN